MSHVQFCARSRQLQSECFSCSAPWSNWVPRAKCNNLLGCFDSQTNLHTIQTAITYESIDGSQGQTLMEAKGVAITLKKLRTSKGDYRTKQGFSSIAPLIKMGTSQRERILSFKGSSLWYGKSLLHQVTSLECYYFLLRTRVTA